MPPKARYLEGEKVLCYHGPLLYEAKCLKTQYKERVYKYFIHYSGWNKNWDEWVPENRVLKLNDSNLKKQKELQATYVKAKKPRGKAGVKKELEKEPVALTNQDKPSRSKAIASKAQSAKREVKTPAPRPPTSRSPASRPPASRPSATRPSAARPSAARPSAARPSAARPSATRPSAARPSAARSSSARSSSARSATARAAPRITARLSATQPAPPTPPKKRIPPSQRGFVDETPVPKTVKINLSKFLNDWLLDDWDLVTRQKKLLTLPARVTVDHIIASYVKEKVSVKGLPKIKENTIVYIANRIRDCFNVLLGKQLLYKFERPQYAEILTEYRGSNMCQIYGSMHLLRMFTKLGEMLTPIQGTENGTEKGMSSLVGYLEDFSTYLTNNESFFSFADYYVASPVYHRMSL